MTLACLCGGLIEIIVFAIAAFFGPIIGVWNLNRRAKQKCKCVCHPEHKDC